MPRREGEPGPTGGHRHARAQGPAGPPGHGRAAGAQGRPGPAWSPGANRPEGRPGQDGDARLPRHQRHPRVHGGPGARREGWPRWLQWNRWLTWVDWSPRPARQAGGPGYARHQGGPRGALLRQARGQGPERGGRLPWDARQARPSCQGWIAGGEGGARPTGGNCSLGIPRGQGTKRSNGDRLHWREGQYWASRPEGRTRNHCDLSYH